MILIKAYFLPILLKVQTPWKLKAFFFSLQTFIVAEHHFNIYNFIIILFYIDFDHANKKKDLKHFYIIGNYINMLIK